MRHLKELAAALAAVVLLFTLGACGGGDAADDAQATRTAANGDVYNGADVDFATAMIPHHAQALVMVDATLGRDLSPEVQRLAEDIRAGQSREIEQMVDWLTAWDEPVPETMRDHANADDHGTSGHDGAAEGADMPGMMTDEELAGLEAARGPEFETRWLEMMIEHHQGAVAMARTEREAGVFGAAVKLAKSIETAQRAEIAHMEQLLGR